MKIVITPEFTPKIKDWIKNRGGVAVWKSVDLSDLGKQWFTPADVTEKPTWKSDDKPERIITSVNDVEVAFDEEKARFKVAYRSSTNGMGYKLTDTSTKKVHEAVKKAGPDAYYVFDYSTQEAVILAPTKKEILS